MSDVLAIAKQFRFPGDAATVKPYGSGLINDTFVVSFDLMSAMDQLQTNPVITQHPRLGKRAILQRINRTVFPDPVKVMQNLDKVLTCAQQQMGNDGEYNGFLLPPLYYTRDGDSYYQDSNHDVWRALGFIENTSSFDQLQDMQQAHETGIALGVFHRMLGDLVTEQLHDTLPGFHMTPGYLRHYDQVIAQVQKPSANYEDWQFCHDIIQSNRGLAGILVNKQPPLTSRIMHGDPKLNNILFDTQSGKAVSIIDLDTVKPGLIQFDIADCLRSCCNRSGELPEYINDVTFDSEVCRYILEGYLSRAGDMLEARDMDCLFDAIQLLPFELGLRFFTDFLQGNRYFKVKAANDNLYRAKTQFMLLLSIQNQQKQLEKMILQIRTNTGC